MGKPETPHFCDFGIFGRVPEPQNQYYLSLEAPGYAKTNREDPWRILENIMSINLKMLDIQNCDNCRKNGRRNIPSIRLIKS